MSKHSKFLALQSCSTILQLWFSMRNRCTLGCLMFSLAEGAQIPRQSWKMSRGVIVVFSKIMCVCQLTFSNSKAEAGLENVTVSQVKLVLGKNHLFTMFDIFQL